MKSSHQKRLECRGELGRRRPHLECLEDRRLLATVTVDTPLDVVDIARNATFADLPGADLRVSLREALLVADNSPGADLVVFDTAGAFSSPQTIQLGLGQLKIRSSVTVEGPGASNLTIDAGGGSRVLLVADGNLATQLDVTLRGLTLTGGNTTFNGGGIQNVDENLTLEKSVVSGNSSAWRGGGVYHRGGNLNLISSTIANNAAESGGGLWTKINASSQIASVNNSTISGNTAAVRGGGVENFFGLVQMQNSTVTDNSAPLAGGIASKGQVGTETRLSSTIVAGNASHDVNFVAGPKNTFVSLGFNLIGSGSAIYKFTNDDQVGVSNPGLGPLQNNGGTTLTHALRFDSAAIDRGANPLALSSDQRGLPFVREAGSGADVGAYELQTHLGPYVVDSAADENDGDYGPGDLSLREAIFLANGNPGADEIQFDTVGIFATPQIIALTLGKLLITEDVVLRGPGANKLTLLGPSDDDLLTINDSDSRHEITVGVEGFTLTGAGRAAINTSEQLTVKDSLITGNTLWGVLSDPTGAHDDFYRRNHLAMVNCDVTGNRYGVMTYQGYVNITNSRIVGNTGYGVYGYEGKLVINKSTISNNRGGIYANSASLGDGFVRVHESTIADNQTSRQGGGISVTYSVDLEIIDSEILGNSASFGGGVYVGVGSTLLLQQSSLTGNWSTGRGGGVAISQNSSAMIQDSVINESMAYGHGGGLFVGLGSSLALIAANVSDNFSYGQGGGVYAGSGATVDASIISGNSTQHGLDGYDSGNGGGIFAGGNLTITRSQITGNETGNGLNATYFQGLGGRSGSGGGLFVAGELSISDSTVSGNSTGQGGDGYYGPGRNAGSGGGIYAEGPLLASNLILSDNTTGSGGNGGFWHERGYPGGGQSDGGSGGSGAGLFALGDVSLIDSEVTGNHTGSGGAGYTRFSDGPGDGGKGGGIYVGGDMLIVNNSMLSGNTTGSGGQGGRRDYCPVPDVYCYVYYSPNGIGGAGGGIYAAGSASIVDSAIHENLTGDGDVGGNGGGVWAGENLLLSRSQVTGNITGSGGHSPYGISTGSGGHGGGIYTPAALTLSESTVSGNSTGTGIHGGNGGGVSARHATITGSTLTGNVTSPLGNGGGLHIVRSAIVSTSTLANNQADGAGGGVYAEPGSYLIFEQSTAIGNRASGRGGGIASLGVEVAIVDSSLSSNLAAGDGGGIAFAVGGPNDSNQLTITRSEITDNQAGEDGGGVFVLLENGSFSTPIRVNVGAEGSTIAANRASGSGGGIAISSLSTGATGGIDAELNHSTILNNEAGDRGGGVALLTSAALDESQLTANTSNFVANLSGNDGGGIYSTGRLTLQASIVSGNQTRDGHDGGWGANCNPAYYCEYFYYSGGDAGHGGGVFASGPTSILSSSIIANVTGNGGDGGDAGDGGSGAGVYSLGGPLTIRSSTISGNVTGEGGSALPRQFCHYTYPYSGVFSHCEVTYGQEGKAGIGGGVRAMGPLEIAYSTVTDNSSGIYLTGTASFAASILAGNQVSDVDESEGNILSLGFNLIGQGSAVGSFGTNDLVGILNPLLEVLADNGGPTPTHLPQPLSPAVDAGNPLPVDAPSFDQRGEGFVRIVGERIDIGAVESQASPTFIDFTRTAISSYGSDQDGEGVATVVDGGATLHIVGNAWKKIELFYEITANTVLEFDFQSSVQGEIHGIGLDNDDAISGGRTFRLYGTQSFGLGDYADYGAAAPDVKHYRIAVGDFYQGLANSLFFVNDHDLLGGTGESVFSNVRIYEADA